MPLAFSEDEKRAYQNYLLADERKRQAAMDQALETFGMRRAGGTIYAPHPKQGFQRLQCPSETMKVISIGVKVVNLADPGNDPIYSGELSALLHCDTCGAAGIANENSTVTITF